MENELINEQAREALPPGVAIGAKLGSNPPDEGNTEELVGTFAAEPWEKPGAGAGAKDVFFIIVEEGGTISGGNCWGPASDWEMQNQNSNHNSTLNGFSLQLTQISIAWMVYVRVMNYTFPIKDSVPVYTIC